MICYISSCVTKCNLCNFVVCWVRGRILSFTWPGDQYVHFVWTQCASVFGTIETETFGASNVGYNYTIFCEDDAALCLEAILWYKPGVTFCLNLLLSIYTRHFFGKWEGKTLTFWAESTGLFEHQVYFVSVWFCCRGLQACDDGAWTMLLGPATLRVNSSDSPTLQLCCWCHSMCILCIPAFNEKRISNTYMLKVPLTNKPFKPRRDLS